MAEATIPVNNDVKAKVDAEKQEGETYNGTLLRLLGENRSMTESEVREIVRQEVVPEALE